MNFLLTKRYFRCNIQIENLITEVKQMDAKKLAEIKDWYKIIFDFLFDILVKMGISTDKIPSDVYPEA